MNASMKGELSGKNRSGGARDGQADLIAAKEKMPCGMSVSGSSRLEKAKNRTVLL
jgi:hypothetical protein